MSISNDNKKIGQKPGQMTGQMTGQKRGQKRGQRGGFVLGLIVGVLVGLAVALGVALYITKVPIPFINKVPLRTAEHDAEETQRNKNWDPNAPLAGKAGAKTASGVVSMPPAAAVVPPPVAVPVAVPVVTPASAPPPVAVAATPKPEKPAADKKPEPRLTAASAAAVAGAGADAYLYFVQAGAYTKADDAEQQRAKLALQGFTAKVLEREQAGRTVFRVRLGPLDNRDEAENVQRKIEAVGIEANLVRVQR